MACLASLFIFFREFFESGFNLVAGNVGDNRFLITILEHWLAFARGQAHFTSPNFFWPEHGVLGYSDSLFLFSLPYSVARAAGADHYIAFEITLILFKVAGFISMLWLLRSFIGVGRTVAILGSSLFTISNSYVVSLGHAQLVTVTLVPLLTGLACGAWRAFGQGQKVAGCTFAGVFGALLALAFFTSFYIAWFTAFGGGVTIVIAAVMTVVNGRRVSALRPWLSLIAARKRIFWTSGITFCVSIAPFLVTYLPALKRLGGVSFEEVLLYSAQPIDLLNIGRWNWIWGRPLNAVMLSLDHSIQFEIQSGWPPLTLGMVLIGLIVGLKQRKLNDVPLKPESRFLLVLMGVSFTLCWLLTLKMNSSSSWSPWWVIFKFVPGGSAIRIPARFNLVLNVFAIIAGCIVLNNMSRARGSASRMAFGAVSIFLIAEQINGVPTHVIPRDKEDEILSRAQRPPADCASFFLAYPAALDRPFYANQMDAMLIARKDNLPTLNGYSSFVPAGWEFLNFDDAYLTRVQKWARAKDATEGLCGLDLRNGSWNSVSFPVSTYVLDSKIDFRKGGNATLYEGEGWSVAEQSGTWTLGEASFLLLHLPTPPNTDLYITFTAQPFAPPLRRTFVEQLFVNDSKIAEWKIEGDARISERVHIDRALVPLPLVRIEFRSSDPRSPAELGLSIDGRQLSLSLETLTVTRF